MQENTNKKNKTIVNVFLIIIVLIMIIGSIYLYFNKEILNTFITQYGYLALSIWSFTESIFLPIPPDLGIIPMVSFYPTQWALIALVTTISSVLGAIVGYELGKRYGHKLLQYFVTEDKIQKVEKMFNEYSNVAILIAGFTPIPYKVFTILGGTLEMDRRNFIIFSFIGRGLRFFIFSYILYLGNTNTWVQENIIKNLNIIFSVMGIIVVIAFLVHRFLKKKTTSN